MEGDIEAFLYAQLAQNQESLAVAGPQQGGGEIDSLQGLELTLAIEERYGVRLADDDLVSGLLRSIPRLAQLVARRLASSTSK